MTKVLAGGVSKLATGGEMTGRGEGIAPPSSGCIVAPARNTIPERSIKMTKNSRKVSRRHIERALLLCKVLTDNTAKSQESQV